jgi:cold shock CspA family protein
MGKSQETWNKKEKEKKRQKKKEEKEKRKMERKANSEGGGLDNMIAYVDENGMITDTPPDPSHKKEVINAEDIIIGIPKKEEQDEPDPNRKGKVTFYDSSKGYGFIKDQDSQESIFTHVNSHIDEITEGDKVSFRIEQGQRGPNAVDVKLI